MSKSYLRDQGIEARGGQVIEAKLVLVPKQGNNQEENKEIKANRLPDEWNKSPKRLQQVNWMRVGLKNDLNKYGYKKSFCIDTQHGFIRRFVVNPANIHDDYIQADSAYSGEHFNDLLSLGGFENRIYEKGSRNHPLIVAATERNSNRSQIRARVEHVFGCFATSMGGKFTRKIGLKKNNAWWSLKNLTFNFLRYQQLSRNSLVSI